MKTYLSLPFTFLKFWFFSAPKSLIGIFASFNKAFLELFSLTLFIKTFFKPWKNEYRQGLIGFSIGMGMFIKTCFIFVDTLLFVAVLCIELLLLLFFLAWPILTIGIFFYG